MDSLLNSRTPDSLKLSSIRKGTLDQRRQKEHSFSFHPDGQYKQTPLPPQQTSYNNLIKSLNKPAHSGFGYRSTPIQPVSIPKTQAL